MLLEERLCAGRAGAGGCGRGGQPGGWTRGAGFSLELSLPISASLRAPSPPGCPEVVGRRGPESLPAWVIKPGFPEDCCAPTNPAPSSTRASAGWGGGLDTRAPLSPEWGAGPPSPREAAPPSPRWEIRAAAAGSGRERGWAAGLAAPRGSADKAPAAAFVPFSDGVCSNYLRPGRHMGGGGALRAGAAALAGSPARCGPRPSPIPVP